MNGIASEEMGEREKALLMQIMSRAALLLHARAYLHFGILPYSVHMARQRYYNECEQIYIPASDAVPSL